MNKNTVPAAVLCLAAGVIAQKAFSQSDPIATLLARYQAARTPFDGEADMVPGTVIIGDGKVGHVLVYPPEISDTATKYSEESLKLQKVIPLESVDGGASSEISGGAAVQKWAPGVTLDRSKTLTSDQAVFARAVLSTTDMEHLVFDDPNLENIWKRHNRPISDVDRHVWLVQEVFYTKQLNIKNSSQRGLHLTSGTKLPDCPKPDNGTSQKSDNGTSQKSDNGTITKPDKGTSPKPENSSAKDDLKKDAVDGVKKASEVDASAASPSLSLYGYSCVDAFDTAHLVSDTPIAIGIKVVAIGHFTHGLIFRSQPSGFTYAPVGAKQPIFTNAEKSN